MNDSVILFHHNHKTTLHSTPFASNVMHCSFHNYLVIITVLQLTGIYLSTELRPFMAHTTNLCLNGCSVFTGSD